jgi:hypothetical protein
MTCRPWCVDHLHDDDMCVASAVVVNFGDRGEDLLLVNTAAVDLTEAPDGPCLMLHLNGIPAAELDPRQAIALGAAFLAQGARALGDDDSAGYYARMAIVNAARAARAVS